MKKNYIYIAVAAIIGIVVFILWKKKGSPTSNTARATTAGTTVATAGKEGKKNAASTGSAGWMGWLTQGQNVLQNTTGTVKDFQSAGASVRKLGGTFASLWAGGGGAVSSQTSGGGAGVPINYDNPGPNTYQNEDGTSDDFTNPTYYSDITGGDSNYGDYGGDFWE